MDERNVVTGTKVFLKGTMGTLANLLDVESEEESIAKHIQSLRFLIWMIHLFDGDGACLFPSSFHFLSLIASLSLITLRTSLIIIGYLNYWGSVPV